MTELHLKSMKVYPYQRPGIDKGYANQSLHIDIGSDDIEIRPVDEPMKAVFVGGKGFDLWLLWQAVSEKTRWDSPENAVCISSGPMGGTPAYPGSGKSIVTTISPLTGIPIDSNVGGYFGPYLKFAGFDALCVTGCAQGEKVVFIDGVEEKVEIFEAGGLADDAYALSAALTEH
ncbi:MAG: aldehyde ferredoxin oxidoreductase N-terminal domain-containing protein, partial [Desulfobacteraceae bacterium]|nr:aldehyde ferredoxin oxidoreductase N-terminal domain-containing protein [Desulfobacteraceae bacterium]